MICDDDYNAYEQIKDFVTRHSIIYNFEFEIFYCKTGTELLESTVDYHLLFLDIMLGDSNGIEIGKTLRNRNNTALFAIVTNRRDLALEGYKTHAFRYILKPITKDKIFDVLDETLETLNRSRIVLPVNFKRATSYIDIKDIIYVYSYSRKRFVVTPTQEYPTTAPINAIWQELNKYPNFYVPRNIHILNFDHVHTHSPTRVVMSNGDKISFDRLKYKAFLKEITEYLKI